MKWLLTLTVVPFLACAKEGPNTRPLTQSEHALVGSSNTFGFELMKEVNAGKAGQNVFISPLSVSMALGMTYHGARGETQTGIRSALSLGDLPEAEINEGYRGLIELLVGMDPDVTFQIANSIWYREGLNVDPTFVATNQTSFSAEVTALDFDASSASDTINEWVRVKTQDRIDGIVDGGIDPATVMFLIDALYFKGTWTYEFDRDATHNADFTTASGSKKEVRMMQRPAGMVDHGVGDGFQAVDLPYGFELFTMTVLLPDEGKSADDLAAGLTKEKWSALRVGMEETELSVSLPRFELEYKQSLKDVLIALGMEQAFTPGAADFTGISPDGGLYIDEVKHKTFVRVDEEGTEAAAVTSVEVRVLSLPPSFVVDRPFVFVIHDKHSGSILFMGKISDPPPAM